MDPENLILRYKKVENGVVFAWRDADFFLEVNGYMNARNAVSAAMAAQHLGVAPDIAASALFGFAGVAGRMDHAFSTEELDIYIDCFGYLPESLVENMAALREMYPAAPARPYLSAAYRRWNSRSPDTSSNQSCQMG